VVGVEPTYTAYEAVEIAKTSPLREVPETGVEPARSNERRGLSPACLPIPSTPAKEALGGIEPPCTWSEARRVIHYATEPEDGR
jgi:hypothetical protein